MTHIIDSNIVFTMFLSLLSYCTMLLVLCHTTLLVPILYLPCCRLCYYITMLLVLCCTMLLVLYCHYLYHVVGFTIYCCHVAGAILLLLSLMLNFYFWNQDGTTKLLIHFDYFYSKFLIGCEFIFENQEIEQIRNEQDWYRPLCYNPTRLSSYLFGKIC